MKKKKKITAFVRNMVCSNLICGLMMVAVGCNLAELPNSPTDQINTEVSSIGTAKTLQTRADESAHTWRSDSQLVQIYGVNIDSSGENDLPGSLWTFSYTTLSTKEERLDVIFSRQGVIQRKETMSKEEQDIFQTLMPLTAYEHDSDDAIFRAINNVALKFEDIMKLNMKLTRAQGDSTWRIEFLNELGQVSLNQSVNAEA